MITLTMAAWAITSALVRTIPRFSWPVIVTVLAALFAKFGSMYFAVISMTDVDHRREFFAPIIDEVERILAVRSVYLAVRQTAQPASNDHQPTVSPAVGR